MLRAQVEVQLVDDEFLWKDWWSVVPLVQCVSELRPGQSKEPPKTQDGFGGLALWARHSMYAGGGDAVAAGDEMDDGGGGFGIEGGRRDFFILAGGPLRCLVGFWGLGLILNFGARGGAQEIG